MPTLPTQTKQQSNLPEVTKCPAPLHHGLSLDSNRAQHHSTLFLILQPTGRRLAGSSCHHHIQTLLDQLPCRILETPSEWQRTLGSHSALYFRPGSMHSPGTRAPYRARPGPGVRDKGQGTPTWAWRNCTCHRTANSQERRHSMVNHTTGLGS